MLALWLLASGLPAAHLEAQNLQAIEKRLAKGVRKGDLTKEFKDIETELKESAKVLEDPKYQAELKAIGAKMQALDAKLKASLKVQE